MKKVNPMIWVLCTGLALSACNGSGKKTDAPAGDTSAKTTTAAATTEATGPASKAG